MENFLFYKTNKSFNNFKSFNNHVRSYAKRNGLNLSQLLKENYDILFRNTNLCIHCGCECEYINYTLGYKNPCYSSECYRTFVESNKEYFYNQTGKFYYDLYDNKQYNCPFTKRYFTLVNEKLSENRNFFVSKKCLVCKTLINDVSAFSRSINIKTCSNKCRHTKISKEIRKNNFFVIDEKIFNDHHELNHYIFINKKYPTQDENMTNKLVLEKYKQYPELRLPKSSSKIYYSKKYNLYFYKNNDAFKGNTLYEYLDSSIENYLNYHSENKLGKTTCPGCNKNILFEDVFGTKLIKSKYCTRNCYYTSLIGKTVSFEQRMNNSIRMKRLIYEGKFTPPVTNSWCRSKTKVIILGKEKYVRSSWEALFWLLNPKLLYEKIRIPYLTNEGKQRIYVCDFYCPISNTIYEIKPKRERLTINNIIKEKYALDYCKNNSLIYEIIDEDYFLNKIDEIDIDSLVQVIETKTIRNLAKSFRRQFVKCPQV